MQTIAFSIFFFKPSCFTEKFSQISTIHLGIFLGWALCADGVSPLMNTIVSRDQFKPTRIGENLVEILVNYN